MSLRRTPADVGKVDHASEIRKTIEHAKLAHDSFMRSNPDISAVMTEDQKEGETKTPFTLKLSQEFKAEQGGIVEVSISLSGGVFSRLFEMSDVVTTLFAPLFVSTAFTVVDGGTVNKVCSSPSASYTTWKFSKQLDAETRARVDATTATAKFWVLPSGGGSVLQFLITSFGVPANQIVDADNGIFKTMVGDNFYQFQPGAVEEGKSAEFRLVPQ